jgi:hypothetical protein
MTLIITMIRPEGIWQSADHRVMVGRKPKTNAAPKQLHIVCPPLPGGPQILLAFTGLAELSDGTPMIRWLRETLRGQSRYIMPMFDYLCDRLTRDISNSSYGGIALVLSGGIFEGAKRFYVELRNVDPKTWRVKRQFDYKVVEVTEPTFFIGGSGLVGIRPEDIELLKEQSKIRPAKWEDHLGLLAGVNRRTAEKLKDQSVSPWCQASFLSSETEGAQFKQFSKPGEPSGPVGIPLVNAGIDIFEITNTMAEAMQRSGANEAPSMPDINEELRRSVEGRP